MHRVWPAVDADGIGSFQTKVGPDTLYVIEKWADADALKTNVPPPGVAQAVPEQNG